MLSIICVFNDIAVLKNRLLSGLALQNAPHEVITVDNIAGRFDRAATALNWGAARAHGESLVFVHQDVQVLAPDWLSRAETFLQSSALDGWSGIAGFTRSGKFRGVLLDRAMFLGAPFREPSPVQTLDECLLITRRRAHGHQYFDESLDGWHAYGVEACCAAIRSGQVNHALPLPVWHDSKSTNMKGLEAAHRYVWEKHGAALARIATTCGDLPNCYDWGPESQARQKTRLAERLRTSYYHRLGGYPGAFSKKAEELIESMTESEDAIECLHAPAWYDTIEAHGFVQQPARTRRIFHRFKGWERQELKADCVVVAADLMEMPGESVLELRRLRQRSRRVLVCVDGLHQAKTIKGWRALKSEARSAELTQHWDGTPSVILEL
jgi:hypothetical protein